MSDFGDLDAALRVLRRRDEQGRSRPGELGPLGGDGVTTPIPLCGKDGQPMDPVEWHRLSQRGGR